MTLPSKRGPAIVVRQPVIPGRPYRNYRQPLREDFWWSCAYCSITEMEASGIAFEIDHYLPQSHGGSDNYDNLMYSCDICNRKKSSWLSDSTARSLGIHVIRVDEEDPRDHIGLGDNGISLLPKTKTGEHNIRLFDLDGRRMSIVREKRACLAVSHDTILHGLRTLRGINIDMIPKKQRADLCRHRQDLEEQLADAIKSIGDLAKAANCSELLDPDPEKARRSKKRREYLKEVNAVAAAARLAEDKGTAKKNRKRRRKRKRKKKR